MTSLDGPFGQKHIEAGAAALEKAWPLLDPDLCAHDARLVLEASLALTTEIPCTTCGGGGFLPEVWTNPYREESTRLCPDCSNGVQTVALMTMRNEQP